MTRARTIAIVLAGASLLAAASAHAQPADGSDAAPTVDVAPAPQPDVTPGPAHTTGKGRPNQLKQAAREAFEAAVTADAKGDLKEAIKQYERAQAIAPHAFTAYNLADAYRRGKDFHNALRWYDEYLKLDPNAQDRGAVEAMIDQIHRTPSLVTIKSSEPHGQIYIDGKHAGAAPLTLMLEEGSHDLDVVTPITWGSENCSVPAGGTRECEVRAKPRVDGNVVFDGPRWIGGESWPVKGIGTNAPAEPVRFQTRGRFQVPPEGAYPIELFRNHSQPQCEPVYFTGPRRDDEIYFVWIEATKPDEHEHHAGPPTCVQVKLRLNVVKFKE